MESVEVSARSVEEAVQQALTRLGKNRDEVEVTVLSEGHRRILGFVRGENARVRVTVLESAPMANGQVSPRAAAPRETAPRPTPARTPRSRPAPAPAAEADAPKPLRVEGAAAVAKDTA